MARGLLSRNWNLRDCVGPRYSGIEAMTSKNPRNPLLAAATSSKWRGLGSPRQAGEVGSRRLSVRPSH